MQKASLVRSVFCFLWSRSLHQQLALTTWTWPLKGGSRVLLGSGAEAQDGSDLLPLHPPTLTIRAPIYITTFHTAESSPLANLKGQQK